MNGADKHAGGPRQAVRLPGQAPVELVQPKNQAGAGVNHRRFVRTGHLVHRRPGPADQGGPDKTAPADHRQGAVEILGNQHGIAMTPGRDQTVQLAAIAPGKFMQIMGGEQHRAGRRSARRADRPQRLDGGGDA